MHDVVMGLKESRHYSSGRAAETEYKQIVYSEMRKYDYYSQVTLFQQADDPIEVCLYSCSLHITYFLSHYNVSANRAVACKPRLRS